MSKMNFKEIKIAIVVSRFNKEISDLLIKGVLKEIKQCGGSRNNLDFFEVPGSFEVPQMVKKILLKNNNFTYNAIIALGSIIKGETAHFEFISSSVFNALSIISINQDTNIPITLGILTTYNYEQALIRANSSKKNKGGEVLLACLESIKNFEK